MNDLGTLKARLDRILGRAEQHQSRVRSARDAEMQALNSRRDEFERVASRWIREDVIPRLSLLTGTLPHVEAPECSPGGCSASLRIRRTEGYPVSASLSISILPDAEYRRGTLHLEPTLIPMFAGHPRPVRYECEVVPGPFPHPGVVEDVIVRFVESYLEAANPDSPYQRDALVRDPVCGMSIPRAEAADSVEHEGVTHFFCAPSCVERFLAAPGRYLPGGGTRSDPPERREDTQGGRP